MKLYGRENQRKQLYKISQSDEQMTVRVYGKRIFYEGKFRKEPVTDKGVRKVSVNFGRRRGGMTASFLQEGNAAAAGRICGKTGRISKIQKMGNKRK